MQARVDSLSAGRVPGVSFGQIGTGGTIDEILAYATLLEREKILPRSAIRPPAGAPG